VFLNEPAGTNFDLSFNLFGFPVRVHPLFFVLPIVFVAGPNADGPLILIFALTFFISILVHELGHAVVMKYFGRNARIVLYLMGGLAIPESSRPWGPSNASPFSNQQQILVSLAGPVAGFLLAIVFAIVIGLLGGWIVPQMMGVIPVFLVEFDPAAGTPFYLAVFLKLGLMINVYLNLLNLAPVLPLDGGRISRELFVVNDPWHGVQRSLVLSIAVGALIAIAALMSEQRFIAIFFGFMAWNCWMTYQQTRGGGFGGGFGGGW